MGAHECSWQVMSAELYYQTINKKCQDLKWPHFSILTISHSIFHQIIKNLIFLKSTLKGLLKNVQYGLSRPLGSREIQKTKVANVSGHLVFTTCSHFVRDLFMSCSWVVNDLFTTCSLVVNDLSTTCLWFVHNLFMFCLWLVYDLFITC